MRELSDRAGRPVTLADVPQSEFDCWRAARFTHIWLMGVWTGGPRARAHALGSQRQRRAYTDALPGWQDADVAASPYAVAAYQVPPALGGMDGLQQFRRRLQADGLKLLLDFVPNHVGLDHPWLRDRPDLFVQSPGRVPGAFLQQTVLGPRWLAHGKDPNFPPWADTAQLDYRRPETRRAMLDQLLVVAALCDGVRCDMAMLLLNDVFARTWAHLPAPAPPPADEFWDAAIAAVRRIHPGFLFLAEVYWGLESRLQDLGFDFTYDKILYDRLIARDAPGVQRHLLGLSARLLAASAHFLENHDEPRVASLLSPAEHRAAALAVFALPGLRLLHDGQLSGARRHTPVQLLRRLPEPPDPAIEAIYQALLPALAASAVGQGTCHLFAPRPAWPENPTWENFLLIQWQHLPAEFDLVMVNLASHRAQCYAPLRLPDLPASTWSLKDSLGPESYRRPAADLRARGLYLDLPPHGTQLFHFAPSP